MAIRFPIRLKILLVLLLVVSTVVGLITLTMANLYHKDKFSSINHLAFELARNSAAEARMLLDRQRDRIRIFARLMQEEYLSAEGRDALFGELFEDYYDFLAVTLHLEGGEDATVYNDEFLKSAGLDGNSLASDRMENPLSWQAMESGALQVRRSFLSEDLPALSIAVLVPSREGGEEFVAEAVVRMDGFLALAGRSELGQTRILDKEGKVLLSSGSAEEPGRLEKGVLARVAPAGEMLEFGMTLEFARGKETMIGGYTPVRSGDLFVLTEVPKVAAFLSAGELLGQMVNVSLGLFLCAVLFSLLSSSRITRELDRLSRATGMVAGGRFDIRLEEDAGDEFGGLARSFNRMAAELGSRERELKAAQAALIQSEKMAAFGQLGAGIAHEVKNPLGGILGLAQLSRRKVEPGTLLHRNLSLIEQEARRCKEIVDGLMKFARREKGEFSLLDLNTVVAETIELLEHQVGIAGGRLERRFGESLPPLAGNANQLKQVFMNLVINAQQAMAGEPGEITLESRRSVSGGLELLVRDTGPGVPREVGEKIFEPFFTTKPSGEGTGLGLSVSYRIVKSHSGEIRLESRPGEGTTFFLTFPAAGPAEGIQGEG